MADKYRGTMRIGGTVKPMGKYPGVLIEDVASRDGTWLPDYISQHAGTPDTATDADIDALFEPRPGKTARLSTNKITQAQER